MQLTDKGYRPIRFAETDKAIQETLQKNFQEPIDLSEDALLGVLTGIFSLSETHLWNLSQGVYDSANLLSAEGTMLENLALLVGKVRGTATYTRGGVLFEGSDGTTVKKNDEILSVLGDLFVVEEDTTISSTACVELRVKVQALVQGASYTLEAGEIGSTATYRREATTDQTKLQILEDLAQKLIAGDSEFENTKVVGTEDPYLLISKLNKGQNMSISGTTFLGFSNVVSPAVVLALNTGNIPANARTLTKYKPINLNPEILSVYNPLDLNRGRAQETDSQLRKRVIESYNLVAGGTPDAIQRAVSAVSGVSSAKVIENRTFETSADSRKLPPKSFQVIVYNGDSQLIAEAIWANKPAGIQCYADRDNVLTQKILIEDYNGQEHNVYFVRPETKYIYLHVDYNLYDEESFPDSGELIITEELVNYGQSLKIGQEVIADRFYPHVYRNVKGVDDVNVYIAETSLLGVDPIFPNDYVSTKLSVLDEEITNFANGRVTVQVHSGDLPTYP